MTTVDKFTAQWDGETLSLVASDRIEGLRAGQRTVTTVMQSGHSLTHRFKNEKEAMQHASEVAFAIGAFAGNTYLIGPDLPDGFGLEDDDA